MFKGRGAVFVAAAFGLLTAFTAQPAAAAPGPSDQSVSTLSMTVSLTAPAVTSVTRAAAGGATVNVLELLDSGSHPVRVFDVVIGV